MSGKLLMGLLLLVAALMGGGLWYSQNYAYYDVSEPADFTMTMTHVGSLETLDILANDFTILDADTSPLKFRACFTVENSIPMLTETYVIYDTPTPLRPPAWFGCFDYQRLTEDLESGEALAFLSQHNIVDGVDRVIAVYGDGRAFAWHQLNEKYAE